MGAVPVGDEAVKRLEVRARLDRHTAEAVRLELYRLAKRHGIDVRDIRVESDEPPAPG